MSTVLRRFVWVVLLFHGFAVAEVPPEDYFSRKEEQVREMAAQIVMLDQARCDLLANCSSSCSRHACTPIDGFHDRTKYNFTCQQEGQPNQYCGSCKSRQVNYGMSYIRMPPNATASEIPDEMCSTICMTRDLTVTVRALADENDRADKVSELFNFGSIDGISRSYPGEELSADDNTCIKFDPRRRGWYNGAISVKTHLIVLIDNSNDAANSLTSSPSLSFAIDASKAIIQELIQSSSSGDRVDVITFNETNATVITNLVTIIGDDNGITEDDNGSGELKKSKTYLHGLIDKITPSDSAAPATGRWGFVQAITTAFQRINNSDDSHDSLSTRCPRFEHLHFLEEARSQCMTFSTNQVILVFTNGGFASDFQEKINRQSVSRMFNNQSTKLFIYSFKISPNLQALAAESGGYFEFLKNSFDNPLYQISSFFNFMALTRNASTKEPYWTKFYKDFDDRGNIITVSYQALSPKGHLVGVAAIDIRFKFQQGGVPPALEEKSGIRPTKSRSSINARFEVRPTNNTICGSCKGSVQAVCPKSSSKSFIELECCDTCRPETHEWRTGKIIVATLVPVVVVLTSIIAATWWWWRRRSDESKSEEAIMTNTSSLDVGPYR